MLHFIYKKVIIHIFLATSSTLEKNPKHLSCIVLESGTLHSKKRSPGIWTFHITNIMWVVKLLCPFLELFPFVFYIYISLSNPCITEEPEIPSDL